MQLAVHLGQDVGSAEGGPALGHASAPPRRPRRRGSHRPGRRRAGGADRCDRPARRPRDAGRRRRSPRPAGASRPVISARLWCSLAGRVSERRPAPQVEDLHAGRLAAIRGDELADQDRLALLDGGRALRELGHQGLGHPGHFETELLGVAASPTVPAPPQLLGQQVAEHALVQLGESHDGLEQAPRIERPPRAVGDRAGAVGHHHMVVELGIPGPRVPVGEGGGHDSFNVFLHHAVGARTRVEHLALGVGEHDLDGAAMAGVDPGLGLPVGQRPGDGDRLGRREGQVEPGDGRTERSRPWPVPRPRCGPSPRPVRRRCGSAGMAATRSATRSCQGEVRAVGLTAERLAGDRVGAHPEQIEQVLFGHLRTRLDPAAVVEAAQAGAQEHAGRGPRRCVVAGQVGGVTRGAVTDRDRLHQVAIARPQGHPA